MSHLTRRKFVANAALSAGALIGLPGEALSKLTDSQLAALHAGFGSRRDAAIGAIELENFQPHPLEPPLSPGRPPYTRAYGYSVTAFALGAFWRNQHVADANLQLMRLCQYFIANGDARNDDDNFYWWTNQLVRTIKFYGREGSMARGRLSSDVEDAANEMMWLWVKRYSLIAETEIHPDYWFVRGSENHHLQGFTACWCFCDLLLKDPRYRDRLLDDGRSVADHFTARTAFAKYYFAEKAKRGIFVESASSYNAIAIKGIYDFYDFTTDLELKRRAGMMLDLFWASWAQEQLDGVRGGGKARTYPTESTHGEDGYLRLAWFYLGMGSPVIPARPDEMGFLTSTYRLPLVVMELALDRIGRGVYEIKQWPLGLAIPGYHTPQTGYRLKNDAGGIYRYSYCTPDFILGTLMFEARPEKEWTMISSQNRWQGLIFEGNIDARIYPVPQPLETAQVREYNAWWSVQSRGTLITQRLGEGYSQGAGPMQVWFSRSGLDRRIEREGWVFTAAPSAYAAVRVVQGGYKWEEAEGRVKGLGDWLVCEDPDSAVILEVARKTRFHNYEAFEAEMIKKPVQLNAGHLKYASIYGDRFDFDCATHHPPLINGRPPDYSPRMSFESPFLSAGWNSGIVDIRMGSRHLKLNFNYQSIPAYRPQIRLRCVR